MLVVDDNALLREGLARALRTRGFAVATAATAAEALAALTAPGAAFDAVVLDVVLPGASGFDVLQAIHQDPRWSGLPVLLITAAPEPTLSVAALERGAADFVPKPFRLDELLLRIRHHATTYRALRTAHVDVERHRHLQAMMAELLEGATASELFHSVVRHLAAWAGVRRAYLAEVPAYEDAVLLSSSQPFVAGQRLPLWAYPELRLVLETRRRVHISNVEGAEAFAAVQRLWRERQPPFALRSVVAMPFGWRSRLAVVVARAESDEPPLGYGACEAVEWATQQLVRALVRIGEDAWCLESV